MNVRTKMVVFTAVVTGGIVVAAPAAYSMSTGPAPAHSTAAHHKHVKKPKGGDGYGAPTHPAPSYNGTAAGAPSVTPSARPGTTVPTTNPSSATPAPSMSTGAPSVQRPSAPVIAPGPTFSVQPPITPVP